MDLIQIRSAGFAGRRRGRQAGGQGLGLIAIAVAIVAIHAPTAGAAPEPGTPVPVAPGVPGQGRAWELVTGEDPMAPVYDVRAISADGNRLVYRTLGPPPWSSTGAPLFFPNFAVRQADGWVNSPGAVPDPEQFDIFSLGLHALSPDLRSSIWSNMTAPPVAEGEWGASLYRGPLAGPFSQLAAIGRNGRFLRASPDLDRIVFSSNLHLLPSDAGRLSGQSIYEVDGSELRQVDLATNGSLLSPCGSVANGSGVVSGDALRVFFGTESLCEQSRVFLRENGSTTEISASQCNLPDCGQDAPVEFAGATPDGSHAFLVARERLTNDNVEPDHQGLYRYDVASGDLVLISPPDLIVPSWTVQSSPDGSRVYFVGFNDESGEHLYLADEDGVHGPLSIPSGAYIEWSADSRYAIFATPFALLPGDEDVSADVYRYDAEQGTYTRISMGTGGRGSAAVDAGIAPDYYNEGISSHPYRAMAADGSRVFFVTAEALLPEDENDAADVYEWASGDLALISPGVTDRPAHYVGATPEGRTAFFRTSLTLKPRDRDGGATDVYAARIGGGLPEPVVPPPACTGDGCRPQVTPRAPLAVPHAPAIVQRIRVRGLGAAARRRAVERGALVLLAEAPEAGRLSVRARAQVGERMRTIGAAAVDAEPGPVRLRVPLSEPAQRELARGGSLSVRLVLRLAQLRRTETMRIELRSER